MLRRLFIWLLLVPLFANGLWMVCSPTGIEATPSHAHESADCVRICAALEAEFGRICLIWPGDKPSITVVDFGAAILPDEILLPPLLTDQLMVAELPPSYASPGLLKLTPPPKA